MSLDENKRPDTDEVSEPAVAEIVFAEQPDTQPENAADAPVAAEDEKADDRFSAFNNPVRQEKKAKKQHRFSTRTRTLITAVTCVVVLVAVLLLIPLLPEDAAGSTGSDSSDISADTSYTLIDKAIEKDKDDDEEPITVTKLELTNTSGKFTIDYNSKGKEYKLAGFGDLDLQSSQVTLLTDCATTFTAQEKINNATKLADFGLDKPAATATMHYHDNTTVTVLFGNQTPAKDGYYVTLKESNEVYVCSESMVSPFLLQAERFVQTSLITAPSVKSDDANGMAVLKSISYSGRSYPNGFAFRRSTSNDPEDFTYFTYIITKPYTRGVSEAISTELSTFTSLTANQAVVLHPTDAQLKKYGFDNPAIIMKVELAVETTEESATSSNTESSDGSEIVPMKYYNSIESTIRVGSTDNDGNYFVMIDDINVIYQVHATSLSVITERSYANTVTELLFLKDITQLSRAKIITEKRSLDLKLTHYPDEEDRDKMMVVSDGKKTYSTSEFRALYQLAMGMNRYDAADTQPTGESVLTLAFYNTDGSLHLQVDFYATSSSLFTAKTTEGEMFKVKASNITHFVQQVENYVNGKDVTEL